MGLRELFDEHIHGLQSQIEIIMQELSLDACVFSAGEPGLFFEDDQHLNFRTNHSFRYFCPLEGGHHVLVLRPQVKPELRFFQAQDYWHETPEFEADFWGEAFTLKICSEVQDLWRDLPQGRVAYHGPDRTRAAEHQLLLDVPYFLARMNWLRLKKTRYEVQCLGEASRLAAQGHKAAEKAFRQGGSEFDIYFAYLQAIRCQEHELPYGAIIALNEKASYLHYTGKRDEVHNGKVLLIDAGAPCRGYGSDITRTYATEDAPEEFIAILKDMEALQQHLVAQVGPNVLMEDLQLATHLKIAELLLHHKVIRDCTAAEALETGITSAFYPHGLGHMLGIFVHDVAGKQQNRDGLMKKPDPRFPALRTTRPLEIGTVVTIEPGLYFIKMLLDPLKNGAHRHKLNVSLIDRLMPCGGIRIEDNIYIGPQGVRNLTREVLPQ